MCRRQIAPLFGQKYRNEDRTKKKSGTEKDVEWPVVLLRGCSLGAADSGLSSRQWEKKSAPFMPGTCTTPSSKH